MPIKTLGSLGKIRVGWVTGNIHIFFWPQFEKCANKPHSDLNLNAVYSHIFPTDGSRRFYL